MNPARKSPTDAGSAILNEHLDAAKMAIHPPFIKPHTCVCEHDASHHYPQTILSCSMPACYCEDFMEKS
jgi:hypothetical protein